MLAPSPRILIVDNDAIITHLVSTMLQKKGYTIAGIVGTGGEALIKTAELVPDLVIIDANLPGAIDGIDAAHSILQLFHVPVVIVAGMNDEEKLSRIKYAKPYGIVFRPFTAVEMTTSVELALYNHQDQATNLGNLPVGEPRKMLDNPAEAVIILDKRGRIIFLNTFASWFVDISAKEALMRSWRDVMVFINDQTGTEFKDPVADVTRQMAATIFDSNTAMLTTTSKRRKVLVTIPPLRDCRDRFFAVLMSLREDVKKVYM
jgi:two-component system, response regulator PdtaR